MRALWIDLFMELDKVTKKSVNSDQPVVKIRFEIFKTLSWSQFLTDFDEILTFCSTYWGVEKLLAAFSRTGSCRTGKSVSVLRSLLLLIFTSIFLITNKRCCSNILASLTSLLGTSPSGSCVFKEKRNSQVKPVSLKTGSFTRFHF